MKKPLLLCVLALSLASCDISSFLPNNNGNNGNGERRKHDGVSLNLSCSDDLGLKRVQDNNYVTNLNIEPQSVGSTTIKRLDGQITFYMPPTFCQGQLQEVDDNNHPDYLFVESQIEFAQVEDKKIDFAYLTSIAFSCSDPSNKFYQNLRVAIFNKETHEDCYVLSYDPEGPTSKTEYNLDLNNDGKLDSYEDMSSFDKSGPISYTTGMPFYCTDRWELDIPTQREIESNQFDPHHMRLSFTPITIRMWFEGWEFDNSDAGGNIQIDIDLKFAAHY